MTMTYSITPTATRTATRTALAAVALATLAAGCGRIAERATEEAVERAVEADTGGDVDVDFSDDGIAIQSDEGDFTLNVDENGVAIEGTDADGNDFSVDADESGVNAESGDGTFDLDSDGTFTVTDENGEVSSGEVSADGDSVDFSVEGDDGNTVFNSGEGIPDQWPSDIPRPEGLTDVVGTYIADGSEENIVVAGSTGNSAQDTYDTYTARLIEAGFAESSKLNQGTEFYNATFTRGDTTVSVTTQATGESTDVVITVS
jgi:hypothetical protein